MPPTYLKEIEIAKRLALRAGEIMLKYFDIEQEVKIKADNSPVTIADTLINEMVIEQFSKDFPEDGIIGEEQSTSEYGQGRKWFCDPIDGTAGYIWGIPTSMFSLGLVIDGEPVLGIAYDPYLKRMYEGIKGEGSFCNGTPIHVSDTVLSNGYFAVTGSFAQALNLRHIPEIKKRGARLASFSGAVYKCCLVAKGKFVGYVDQGLNGHDLAAAHVIVEEAGGKVTALNGEKLDYSKPFKGGIISNVKAHDEIVEIVNGSKTG